MLKEEGGGPAVIAADGGRHDLAVVPFPTRQRPAEPRRRGVAGEGPEIDGGDGEGRIGLDRPPEGVDRIGLALGEPVPAGGDGGRREGATVPVVGFHGPSIRSTADVALSWSQVRGERRATARRR